MRILKTFQILQIGHVTPYPTRFESLSTWQSANKPPHALSRQHWFAWPNQGYQKEKAEVKPSPQSRLYEETKSPW